MNENIGSPLNEQILIDKLNNIKSIGGIKSAYYPTIEHQDVQSPFVS
jgi:hypothetical protein